MKMCVPSTRILIEFVFIRWYNCAAHYRSMAEWNEWLSWFHRIGVKASILFGRGDNKDCAGCYESVEPDTTTVYLRPKVADHATKKNTMLHLGRGNGRCDTLVRYAGVIAISSAIPSAFVCVCSTAYLNGRRCSYFAQFLFASGASTMWRRGNVAMAKMESANA